MKNLIKISLLTALFVAVAYTVGKFMNPFAASMLIAAMFVGTLAMPKNALGLVTLGQGFAPYLLAHLKNLNPGSNPMMKLEPAGFMNLLLSQSKPRDLRLNSDNGHRKTVQYTFKQRFTKDFVDTTKSCDQTNQQLRLEGSVDLASTRQIAIHINDETIARYEEEASRTVMVGQPATGMMDELVIDLISATSAMIEAIDEDLLTLAAANVGTNRVTGSNAAKTVNLNQDTNNNQLTDGITEIMHDYKRNQGKGRMQMIGSGLMEAFHLQQVAKGLAQNGIDTRILANTHDWYYDLNAADILGDNQVLCYEPDAVQLVEYLEYTGFKAGAKPGGSIFGTLPLPMMMGNEIIPFMFDFQLRYNDCPETVTDAYYGTSLTLQKGYNLIISKQCGLHTIPDNAYRGTDALNGNRGSYRYLITNNCETC